MATRTIHDYRAGAGSSSPACAARPFTLLAAIALIAFALACTMFTLPAHAKTLNAPTTVADDITRLQVNKLDADTHEPVVGATMVIVDENGNTVAEWVSDGSGFSIEKGLDVDVVYTLKELDPPDGYSAISPITFTVDPIEGNGIIINSGDESQYDLRITFESLATGVHSVLNLYDKAGTIENEVVVTETRGVPSNTGTTKKVAPQTGDETPLMPIAMFAVAGIAAILILQVPKRKME